MPMIPYGRQDITDDDLDEVLKVLKSDYLTQGPQVPLFEEVVKNYCGASHAVAVNSATSALHIACLALKLGVGDILWTTPISFVASSNCALYCGATVDFVDIDSKTFNISVSKLKEKLEIAKSLKKLPKILVVVHLCGQPARMREIHELSKLYGFRVIEDASHAIGSEYEGSKTGSCTFSDITIFSFHPVKIITTAEGGMALTNDSSLAKAMELLRSHGITREQELMTELSHGPWYYQQIALGFNYRMTEIQAALGVSQFKRLDAYVEKRNKLALTYDESFKDLPLLTPSVNSDVKSAFHLYVIRLQLNLIKRSHKEVFEYLRGAGIGVNLHYIPIHTQPFYKQLGFKEGMFPEAEKYYSEAISLPMYPQITVDQRNEIIDALKGALVS